MYVYKLISWYYNIIEMQRIVKTLFWRTKLCTHYMRHQELSWNQSNLDSLILVEGKTKGPMKGLKKNKNPVVKLQSNEKKVAFVIAYLICKF